VNLSGFGSILDAGGVDEPRNNRTVHWGRVKHEALSYMTTSQVSITSLVKVPAWPST
jgi:hypothetical protein